MTLDKYSIGIGDRFGHQGVAQLQALQMAADNGIRIAPVWNKSNREHSIIGTHPEDTRREADEAVKTLGWHGSYFVDADHIGMTTVDRFLTSSNFFTIDVADFIGRPPSKNAIGSFVALMAPFKGSLSIPGIEAPFLVDDQMLGAIAFKNLNAVAEAATVYRHIGSTMNPEDFVTEISLDEADAPQTPAELFFILGAIAQQGIPIQTIAPKFTGSFLKGVDYVGDVATFEREFEDDLAVIAFAAQSFRLPANLKLSVHTGSDKFSLYPVMHRAIRRHDVGLHLKTAGTTWLEEVIGLAEAGDDGLRAVKEIYTQAFRRFDEFCTPYLSVIDIDRSKLPRPAEVDSWSGKAFAGALRHNQIHKGFNGHFRQLVHVGYKVAAEMGGRFTDLLERHRDAIGKNVTENIYRRHIVPLFLGARRTE